MFDNVNEWLITVTVALAAAAVALRLLMRVNRVEWLKRMMTWLLGYVDVFLSALVIALVIRSTVIEPFRIPSSSMEDTLLIGDHLFVNRFIYGLRVPFTKSRPLALRQPVRGDIVVFIPPHQRDKDFIKRVVGVPGDVVEIRDQEVYVNGTKLTEPFVVHKDTAALGAAALGAAALGAAAGRRSFFVPRDNMKKVPVPPGSYFMMGDNRDRSEDSRYWGFASLADIKGKALLIYFSWNPDPEVAPYDLIHKVRWGRMFHGIK